jgi:deoxyribonuclease V
MGTTQEATCNFSISKAKVAQTCLSKRIIAEDRLPSEIKLVAGVDVAYVGEKAIGAVAVLEYESLELVESKTSACSVKFPYVPTLLSFREIPAAVASVRKLGLKPDVFLVDGHGMAHPRRCGFASHLGLVIGKPTVGVAKNWLIGKLVETEGGFLLVHDGQAIGSVVTTREGTKPVYVSVGHLISLETAVRIVKHCVRSSRIPEPLLQAHRIASEARELQKT